MLIDESEKESSAQNMVGEGDNILVTSLAGCQRKHFLRNLKQTRRPSMAEAAFLTFLKSSNEKVTE